MNIVDIILILILGYSLLSGMYKGFIASGLSLLGFVASWFGALYSYKTLMRAILSNSTVMGFCSNLLEASSFFESTDASLQVSQVANSDVFGKIASYIAEKVPLVGNAFAQNVNTQAFAGKLFGSARLTTLSDYLDQTVWQAVFGVLSFILMFALIYVVVTLFVNLLNHVISFPLLRRLDWLAGGVFGLLRGLVVAALLSIVAVYVLKIFFEPDNAIYVLISESRILNFVRGLPILPVENVINAIIGM